MRLICAMSPGILSLRVVRLLSPRPLVSVFYHVVSAARLPHVSALYSYKTPEAFERDLLFLKSNYALVTHEQVVAHREYRRASHPTLRRSASTTVSPSASTSSGRCSSSIRCRAHSSS
jgi:hypothetical protein